MNFALNDSRQNLAIAFDDHMHQIRNVTEQGTNPKFQKISVPMLQRAKGNFPVTEQFRATDLGLTVERCAGLEWLVGRTVFRISSRIPYFYVRKRARNFLSYVRNKRTRSFI
jgi:hypothetical protein